MSKKPLQVSRAIGNAFRAMGYDRIATVPRVPLMVYVEVTRRCNLQCRHCDIWMTQRHEPDLADREVPADRLVSELGALAPRGLLAVDLFGGEPLLRSDLGRIIGGLTGRNLHVTVTTNGALLRREKVIELRDAGLHQLLVSVDGPSASIHDGLRGVKGAWDKALAGLQEVGRIATGQIRTGINTLVCRENLSILPDMVDLAGKLGVSQLRLLPYHQCYPFNEFQRNDELMFMPEDMQRLRHTIAEVITRARRYNLVTNGLSYLEGIPAWYEGRPLPVRCQAGLTVCDINAYGDVFPCYTLAQSIGNIKTSSFLDLWNSPGMEAHRRASHNCHSCWQSCYIEPGLRLSLRSVWHDRRAVLNDLREYVLKK
jgi:AdoMet-dependent heme synthase